MAGGQPQLRPRIPKKKGLAGLTRKDTCFRELTNSHCNLSFMKNTTRFASLSISTFISASHSTFYSSPTPSSVTTFQCSCSETPLMKPLWVERKSWQVQIFSYSSEHKKKCKHFLWTSWMHCKRSHHASLTSVEYPCDCQSLLSPPHTSLPALGPGDLCSHGVEPSVCCDCCQPVAKKALSYLPWRTRGLTSPFLWHLACCISFLGLPEQRATNWVV